MWCGVLGVSASAPAKVILFGEHFVVYGEPAVVLAIEKRAYASVELRKDRYIYVRSTDLGLSGFFKEGRFEAECGGLEARIRLEPIKTAVQKVLEAAERKAGVNVEIHSSIPVAAGLGSSAAAAAATATAVNQLLDVNLSRDEICRISYEVERLVHGTPSGIDPTISTYGGVLLFQKGKAFKTLNVEREIPLVIGDTGVERSTGNLVAKVLEKKKKYPSLIDSISKAGGKIALRAVKALEDGDQPTLGDLMNINHALLCAVGVSHESLERLIYAARKAGAFGAKLTGAGGGGCMIALSPLNRLELIRKAVEKAGGKAFIARKAEGGARVER